MRNRSDQQQADKYSKLTSEEHCCPAETFIIRSRLPIHPEMAKNNIRLPRYNDKNSYSDSDDDDDSLEGDYDNPVSKFQSNDERIELRLRRLNRTAPDYKTLRQAVLEELKVQETGQEANKSKQNSKQSQQQSYTWLITLVIGCFALLGLVYFLVFSSTGASGEDVDPQFEKQWHQQNYKHIYMIGNDFPSQKKTIWMDFFSGIKKVLLEKPTEPSIFLLLHHENDITTKCLAQKVASVARDLMNVTRQGLLVVDGQTLGTNEMAERGRFVTKFKPLVEEHRIMIVNDLQMVPADVARSLHTFCDTVTPLVDKAIYIFTLNVDQDGWDGANNPTRVAERELNAAWDELDNDIRQPLIVRITGGHVHKINRETDSKQC